MSDEQPNKYPGLKFFEEGNNEAGYAKVMSILQGLGISPESIVGQDILRYSALLMKSGYTSIKSFLAAFPRALSGDNTEARILIANPPIPSNPWEKESPKERPSLTLHIGSLDKGTIARFKIQYGSAKNNPATQYYLSYGSNVFSICYDNIGITNESFTLWETTMDITFFGPSKFEKLPSKKRRALSTDNSGTNIN